MPLPDGYILSPEDRDELAALLAWWRRQGPGGGPGAAAGRRGGAAPAPLPIHYGLAKADWSADTPNQVVVNRCRPDGSEEQTGTPYETTVYLSLPVDNDPGCSGSAIEDGDLIAYLPYPDIAGKKMAGLRIPGTLRDLNPDGFAAYDFWIDVTQTGSLTILQADCRGSFIDVQICLDGTYLTGPATTPQEARGMAWMPFATASLSFWGMAGDTWGGGPMSLGNYGGPGTNRGSLTLESDGSIKFACTEFHSRHQARCLILVGGKKSSEDLTI